MNRLYPSMFATLLALTAAVGCDKDTSLVGRILGHSFSNDNGCSSSKRLDVETSDHEEIAVCYSISNCDFENSYHDLSPDCGLPCGSALEDRDYQMVVSPILENGKQRFVSPIGADDSSPTIPLYDLIKIEDTFDYPESIKTVGYVGSHSSVGYEVRVDGIDRGLLVRTDRNLGGWGKVQLTLEKSPDKNLTGRPIYDAGEIRLLSP